MAKQALGRNLEELLDNGAKEAPKAAPSGLGVRSLMRGHQAAPAGAPIFAPVRKTVVPIWYLFGGDLLLATLSIVVMIKSPRPMTWPRELFCAGSVTLGAILALIALWLSDQE